MVYHKSKIDNLFWFWNWTKLKTYFKILTRLSSPDGHGRGPDDGGVDGADRDEAGGHAGAASVDQIKAFGKL